jgi:excisionase family DNA binding protein
MSRASQAETSTRVYPVREAFRRLAVSPVTGYLFIRSGELPSYTVGRLRFVTEQALQEFVQKRLAATARETQQDRAVKVERAVLARKRQREAAEAA